MSIHRNHLFIATASQIFSSQSLKFTFVLNHKNIEGFVVNENGQFFAYVNRCRHMGITLDWDTNEFYTREKDALICKTHGATYHPATGECTGGPCEGKSLYPLPLLIESGQIFLDMEKAQRLYGD